MLKEERHDLHLARVEINYFSTLVAELNETKLDWGQIKKILVSRGCYINEETEEIEKNHKQVDIFANFCAFTLVENKGHIGIGYGWVCGMNSYIQNDLYEWGIGDFRPYYNEETKREWELLSRS